MILYHASTVYHSLCCLTHKLAFHPYEEAELLLVEYIFRGKERDEFIQKLESYGWFSQVRLVPESALEPPELKSLRMSSTTQEIEIVAEKICENVTAWLGHDLRDYEEINLLAEQWAVGIAVLYQKIPNNYFEDGSGLLGDSGRYFRIVKEINIWNYVLLKYLNGGGNNSFTKLKYCDMDNQPDGFYDSKAQDFNIYKLLSQKVPEKIPQILKLYHGEKLLKIEKNSSVLFMTQFIRTLSVQDFNIQKRMTTLIWDYFVPDDCQLIVKPHPKDCFIDYRLLDPECIVLDRRLPSELLPFVLPEKATIALTASSTSISGVRHVAREIMEFLPDIESHFYRLPMYYACSRILERIYRGQKINMEQETQVYVRNFLEIRKQDAILAQYWKKSQIWIDVREPSGDPSRDIYLFFDPSCKFLCWDCWKPEAWLMEHIVVSEPGRVEDYFIYIYSENKKIQKELMHMKENRELKRSGVTIEMLVSPGDYLKLERGKEKALFHTLQEKELESQDKVLLEMNTVIDTYYKQKSALEVMMAKNGWKGESI